MKNVVPSQQKKTKNFGARRSVSVFVVLASVVLGVVVTALFWGTSAGDGVLLSDQALHDLKQVGLAPSSTLRGDLRRVSADQIWDALIRRAVEREGNQRIMEVGMHRATQCLQAARAGLEAHCVEPSPGSFQIIQADVNRQPEDIKQRVHLYQNAASDTTGQFVEFMAGGGTGDHIGIADMWNMKNGPPTDPKILAKTGKPVQVSTTRIDDIVKDQKFFLLKVDTQGFEPAVFSGLDQTLASHKADYILTEFWPKGMDLFVNATTTKDRCQKSVGILEKLSHYGYQIYPLSVVAHPKAPREAHKNQRPDVETRPMDDFMKHCQWYYEMEQRFPSTEYHMGYWSDMLAVAPGITISAKPTAVVEKKHSYAITEEFASF